jgi:hypothetical protein
LVWRCSTRSGSKERYNGRKVGGHTLFKYGYKHFLVLWKPLASNPRVYIDHPGCHAIDSQLRNQFYIYMLLCTHTIHKRRFGDPSRFHGQTWCRIRNWCDQRQLHCRKLSSCIGEAAQELLLATRYLHSRGAVSHQRRKPVRVRGSH